jgi:very-short-patch-repair endonuclease
MTHLRPLPRVAEPSALTDVLRRTPRAFTFDELVGMSSARKARTAIDRGEVVRLLPNAYVSALHADSFLARVDAALLWAGPNAALSGAAAMFAWGFAAHPPEVIEVVVPHADRPRPPGWIVVRRLSYRPPTTRLGRATVVGPDLAVIFGYGALPPRDRASAFYAALRSGLTSPRALTQALDRVPRCPMRRELMRRIDAGARGAESYLEEQGLRKVFNTKEFARLARQHWARVDGERFRIDTYDPETMTAIELDGDTYHSDPEQRQRDMTRDATLATVGILTLRLSYRDITERPEWCRALVRGVIRSRSTTLTVPWDAQTSRNRP